jgi:hypothetical protein
MSSVKVNEFMLNLAKELKEKKGVADSTANAYIRAMYLLNGKQPFKNLTFLKKTDDVAELVKDYADNTIKLIYSSIVSVLSLFKEKPAYKKVYEFYYEKMMGKAKEMKDAGAESSNKTEKQKENWISWEEVKEKGDTLGSAVAGFGKKRSLTEQEFETLLHYTILALYTETQPRRNQDYLDMMVVKAMPKNADHNYLVITKGKPSKFIFNIYKTAKKYGQQTLDIPPTLAEILKLYLKFHPQKKETPHNFLVSYDGSPIVAQNAITRVLNKVFGKKVGSSMLRHIFLSTKYDIKEMEKDATAMGHSVEEQKKYMKGSGEEVGQSVNVPTIEGNTA